MREGQDLDIEALRRQVANGNFALAPHAMQHAVKEGFTQRDMVCVALRGTVVEEYPARKRCLLYADVVIEGLEMHRMFVIRRILSAVIVNRTHQWLL